MADDVDHVLAALRGPRIPARSAAHVLPARRGLYAIWASTAAWAQLDVGESAGQPLYIGKAEDSLRRRVAGTHLRNERTGWSTLRRTLAALLREREQLVARPRDAARRARLSNYGLEPASEALLQDWIDRHLEIAIWPAGADDRPLGHLEQAAIAAWPTPPPLNLHDLSPVAAPLAARIRAARREMAASAATWRPAP